MATYHLSLKNGIVGTAKNHAEYILREGRYSNGSRKEELVHHAANLPAWAEDAMEFFCKADIYERINGRAYVEFEVALPNEIGLKDNISLLEKFIESNVGNDKVWAYAVHEKKAAFDDEQLQIHAHVMFSERTVTSGMEEALAPSKFFKRYNAKNPNRGGYKKDRRFSDKKIARENIKNVRKDWEKLVNKIYEEKNIDKRVSSETLKKQKEEAERIYDFAMASFLDREPQEHLGPKLTNVIRRSIKNKDINQQNLDDVLDEIYLISPKAFCIVIDQIDKEKKELEYKKEMLQRQSLKEREDDDVSLPCAEKETTIIIDAKKLMEAVNVMEENLLKKALYNNEEIRKVKGMLLSEKQIGYMALSICTKGQSKKLMKERRSLTRIKKAHEEELSILIEAGKPSFWQFEARKKYDEKIGELTDNIEDVEKQLRRLRAQAENINMLMGKEENKQKMVAMIKKLNERQNARIEYVKTLEKEQGVIKVQTGKIEEIASIIKLGQNYRVGKSGYMSVRRRMNDSDTNEIIKRMNELERLLKNAEMETKMPVAKKNNMRVNLSGPKAKSYNQYEW
ncbi:MAG: MobA/MobL family protein [Parabacteroides sp.]|nr:MobA/MobL family protein [Parabacteroides sp.]